MPKKSCGRLIGENGSLRHLPVDQNCSNALSSGINKTLRSLGSRKCCSKCNSAKLSCTKIARQRHSSREPFFFTDPYRSRPGIRGISKKWDFRRLKISFTSFPRLAKRCDAAFFRLPRRLHCLPARHNMPRSTRKYLVQAKSLWQGAPGSDV